VFVIVDLHQGQEYNLPLVAYREPLDGTTVDEIVAAHYGQHPVGSRIFVVEDTKVEAKDVGLKLSDVDDPRLDDEEGPVG